MKRILAWFAASAVVLILLLAFVAWLVLRASLPQLDGQLNVAGLSGPAAIERDSNGTPTIKARTRADLAFATGFAHAQDRFFQMDLARRAAAGELSALLGPALVQTDKRLRVHGFRYVAREVLNDAAEPDRTILEAYVRGVNASLEALRSRPWEYHVLGLEPQPWLAEDCVLAAFSMYLSLNDSSGEEELNRARLYDALPKELVAFLHPFGTEWDAPLSGGVWQGPPPPAAEVFDLRRQTTLVALVRPSAMDDEPEKVGSNSWAVAGTHSATGRALFANDMHLPLRLPNTWYRARLLVEGESNEARDLVGVTLPGLPMLIAGSNRRVAWGYTNSYGDWADLVVVEPDPQDPARYLVGDGSQPFVSRRETIAVRGGERLVIEVSTTRWGPIVKRDSRGRAFALAWTAHHPSATNLRMLDFESATNVTALLDAANGAGGPVQNVVAADASGEIGWTVMGRVPIRARYDSTVPSSWRVPGSGWTGWREPREYPRVVGPTTGRIWTANTRTIDAEKWLGFMGDGGYDLGARAAQIRDDLLALPAASVTDLVNIQTDDRALFLARWRDLLLGVLTENEIAKSPARNEARQLIEHWSGRASVDDAGYRIVRAFRLEVRKNVFDSLTAAARAKYPDATFAPSAQFEGPLWQLMMQRPAHLLEPRHADWDAFLLSSFDAVLRALSDECASLARCTWGRQNTLQMRHPLSAALPFAAAWLDMPPQALPGDSAMPRVQGTQFGASERFVVSPGAEDEGVFQMPGGPVDHPLSPFYGAGHDAWARADPQPLLPGPPLHKLELAAER